MAKDFNDYLVIEFNEIDEWRLWAILELLKQSQHPWRWQHHSEHFAPPKVIESAPDEERLCAR